MKRIDIVYAKLKELSHKRGVTTEELADTLELNRANVSSDLNKLCEAGRAAKEGVRPVLYRALEPSYPEQKQTVLEEFALKNPTLFSAIEQAKAAVLYPPKGMPILIVGETGVGKSMFTTLIHRYAVEMAVMPEDAPLIIFNCADYANNPQLLLAQLFGSKKGAYTGADSDKAGLIEKADQGILFLDEVHRLPPEGQEMFFTFMDRGTYRRLGETELERSANVLIISATTENPDSVLLKTFVRRIPMIIHLPPLSARSLEERLHLITQFMREESGRLNKPIFVSVNSIRSFLSYHCPNNVGQLKTDIQLVCAKAYADFVTHQETELKINSTDLPPHVRQGLYLEIDHRQLWNKLIGINKRYCIFDNHEEQMLFEEEKEASIYEMIDLQVHVLKGKGLDGVALERAMEKNIEDYFSKYIHHVNQQVQLSALENIVPVEIIRVVEEIVKFAEERLQKTLSPNVHHGMAIHIANAVERIRQNRKIINPQLNKIRLTFPEEFTTAVDCLKIIHQALDIAMPIDEAGFLTMFLGYHDRNIREPQQNVQVIVLIHGASAATSIAETVNNLIGTKYAIGINAPLDEQPHQAIARVKTFLKEMSCQADCLFLVDMGSLTNVGKEIEKELAIKTKTILLVSTLHVLTATRKAMMGYSLDEVYDETLKVNELLENQFPSQPFTDVRAEKLVILLICTTGSGSAMTIKNLLQNQLTIDLDLLELIPMDLVGPENIHVQIKNIQRRYRLVCIVSPFKLELNLPQYGIDEVLNQAALPQIQKQIDIEITYLKLRDTLENQLKHVDSQIVLSDVKEFITHIETALTLKIDTNILIGVALHLSCMIDRLKAGGIIEPFLNKARYISQHPELYQLIKRHLEPLNQKYQINISEDEMCYIMVFFNPENHLNL